MTLNGGMIVAKILAVDDEQENLAVMNVLLQKAGHTVATAMDGSKALAEIERSMPDLVVSDIRMFPMNGLEMLRRIKTKWRDLPVMMVTSERMEEATELLGAVAYLNKPFSIDELFNAVSRALDTPCSIAE